MKVSPIDGGCWYCHQDDEGMLFSVEFDCFLHLNCLLKAIKASPDDPEVVIFASEFEEVVK